MKASSPRTNRTTPKAATALADQLTPGRVYRREDLAKVTGAVDRKLGELVESGTIQKLAPGLYYRPETSRFGNLPPDDHQLVEAFLRDKHFLLFSPSAYNSVGAGTTQLYNSTLVYNHKRHGVFKLGDREFNFKVKPRCPVKLSVEFLFVDLLNNLSELAEDQNEVLRHARSRLPELNSSQLKDAMQTYGSVATKKRIESWLNA
ncbi:MAG: hypothetical protein NTW89_07255 [Burkholderiales bacterium]|nr:hypothetical protein [Burkholderiales bacterium]